ncbi:MAG: DNA translocase FtsK, partial [Gammaproteobacteria bacterium]
TGALGITGTKLLLVALLLYGITLYTGLSWLRLFDRVGHGTVQGYNRIQGGIQQFFATRAQKRETERTVQQREVAVAAEKQRKSSRKPVEIQKPPAPSAPGKRAQQEKQAELFKDQTGDSHRLPQLSLLDSMEESDRTGYSAESLEAMSRLLEIKLKDFGVIAEVVAVQPGPVVTRFEIQPAAGVKASKITGLARDLARSLAVISVRVVEVIAGKSVVGIEVPNEKREMVRLSQVLASSNYEQSKSPLTLAMGHDISGQPVIADLARMPHLLVAGTTGSGKSVAVNVMLLSLLYKATPDEVRLLLVDPKMLELAVYEGIPHLLAPVVTDMKDAANGLRWCVGEMERRYKLMAKLGVRNLAGYNKKVRDAAAAGEPIPDPIWRPEPLEQMRFEEAGGEGTMPPPNLEPLPSIVVVIDEFADMMMIVGKKVEQLIARIAQKARAAGIHLILATQRPSVDVITGLIKANIPTRMAFQVSSRIDSRTILDQGGAEQLLGHGDMLFLPTGTSVPVRVHGAFVDDHEVHKVVEDWVSRGIKPEYVEGLTEESTSANVPVPGYSSDSDASGGDDAESDALYDQAVEFVTESRKASISAVQRKLRIGYNRAARLVEAMEIAGVVTEMQPNGNREVIAPPPPRH